MILGGLALAFSRVIDNSVIALENIYRHLEMGASPEVAAEQRRRGSEPGRSGRHSHHGGGVLPGHLSCTASASFCFPRWLLAVAISLFASYFVAMTVIPLFCARFLKGFHALARRNSASGGGSTPGSTGLSRLLDLLRALRCGAPCGGPSSRLALLIRCLRRQPRHLSAAGGRLLSRRPMPASSLST